MKKEKIFIISLFFLIISSAAIGQKKLYYDAEEMYNAGQYYDAVDLYREAYSNIRDNDIKDTIIFKIAESYRITGQYAKAELWYNNAIRKEYDNPKIYLYYAEALKANEKFDEAIDNYNEYAKLAPDDPRGDMGVKSCELTQKWIENPSGYKVTEMKFLNSTNRDYAPAYSKPEYDEIYFTSTREESTGEEKHGGTGEYFSDIFYSSKDKSDKWSRPEQIPGQINTEVEEGAASLTDGYNTMYFTRCEVDKKESMGCNIYVSEKNNNGEWKKPESIELGHDSLVFAHPSITEDGNTLYFVSNMEGGHGQLDIWKVIKEDNGEWGQPENMGGSINTPGNEVFPFIHPDGTLYFSSDYHPGMGGLDIFKASEEDGKWEIENMRHPINSTQDDFGIIFQAEEEKGFFSSTRDRNDKIFSFVLPPLKFSVEGTVKDEKSEEAIEEANVKMVGSDGMTMSDKTDEDGKFKFMLRPETDYVFVASKEKYLTNKDKASTKGIDESKVFEPEILLSSIEEPIELPNIFYDFAKWSLRDESKEALNQLVETLNDNPRVIIELRAHTDHRGEHWANIELSTKRAESVVDYLIEHGIDSERLRAKGYAATKPKEIDKKLAEEYDFLEEGDVLTEEFIDELETEEQREEAHQINRRTEFKVISTDYSPE
ncbi:MAG: OmpA family protein [Bacteroidales bacterium]